MIRLLLGVLVMLASVWALTGRSLIDCLAYLAGVTAWVALDLRDPIGIVRSARPGRFRGMEA